MLSDYFKYLFDFFVDKPSVKAQDEVEIDPLDVALAEEFQAEIHKEIDREIMETWENEKPY